MKGLVAVVTQQQMLLLAFLATDLTFLQHVPHFVLCQSKTSILCIFILQVPAKWFLRCQFLVGTQKGNLASEKSDPVISQTIPPFRKMPNME